MRRLHKHGLGYFPGGFCRNLVSINRSLSLRLVRSGFSLCPLLERFDLAVPEPPLLVEPLLLGREEAAATGPRAFEDSILSEGFSLCGCCWGEGCRLVQTGATKRNRSRNPLQKLTLLHCTSSRALVRVLHSTGPHATLTVLPCDSGTTILYSYYIQCTRRYLQSTVLAQYCTSVQYSGQTSHNRATEGFRTRRRPTEERTPCNEHQRLESSRPGRASARCAENRIPVQRQASCPEYGCRDFEALCAGSEAS